MDETQYAYDRLRRAHTIGMVWLGMAVSIWKGSQENYDRIKNRPNLSALEILYKFEMLMIMTNWRWKRWMCKWCYSTLGCLKVGRRNRKYTHTSSNQCHWQRNGKFGEGHTSTLRTHSRFHRKLPIHISKKSSVSTFSRMHQMKYSIKDPFFRWFQSHS